MILYQILKINNKTFNNFIHSTTFKTGMTAPIEKKINHPYVSYGKQWQH